MKAADQIFAADQINASLTSDRRIHLGQQRGGDLQNRNPAHENRREKAADICNDAAAEAQDKTRAIGTLGEHIVGQDFHLRQALVRLAAGEEQDVKVTVSE